MGHRLITMIMGIVLALVFVMPVEADSAEVRTWEHRNADWSVKGTLESYDSERVVIKGVDEGRWKINRDVLVKDDREYIKNKESGTESPVGVSGGSQNSDRYGNVEVPGLEVELGMTKDKAYQVADRNLLVGTEKATDHYADIYHVFEGNWRYPKARETTFVFKDGELVTVMLVFRFTRDTYTEWRQKLHDGKWYVVSNSDSRLQVIDTKTNSNANITITLNITEGEFRYSAHHFKYMEER